LYASLFGCETWSLILREVLKLKVLDNKARRKKFEPDKQEVTGGLIKLCNAQLHYL